ncbi:hypothetical protein SDC9_73762 [bioreactor metagenome]|uniref:Uncharacterized protein n=1 Tax=bioreactor metagenome TaxID=1076179 RepID=A0A644YF70_9ZZZZ
MTSLYVTCVKQFNWSLKDIDETNFETLVEFLFFKPEDDPNVRVIGGKTFIRASGTPDWL